MFPGVYLTRNSSYKIFWLDYIFWLTSFYHYVSAALKDPVIIPRGNLEEEDFKKNDEEMNLYDNYISQESEDLETEEDEQNSQNLENEKNQKKRKIRIYWYF